MSVVEDADKWIQAQFVDWANNTCTEALRQAIDDTCTQGLHRTGTLVKSVSAKPVSEDLFHVGTEAFYGGYVNDGRGEAKPHGDYLLHWTSPSGHHVSKHRSPPSRPRKFIAAAVAKLS